MVNESGKDSKLQKELKTLRERLARMGKIEGERKKAERALKESEERFRSFFENAIIGMVMADNKGRFLWVNKSLCDLLGYSKNELLGMTFSDISHPDDAATDMANMEKILSKEITSFQIEKRQLQKNGNFIWVLLSASVVYDSEGNVWYIVGQIHDIGDQKKGGEALKESEEKFRTLAEQSPNMIYINKMGQIIYANKMCEELMGCKREVFYAPDFNFMTLVAPESQELLKKNYGIHMRGEDIPPYECTYITKNGVRIETINATKIIEYGGEKAIIGIITDITQRKNEEEKIKKQLMGFHLEEGNLYLVKESMPVLSVRALNDLLKVGHHGIVISRAPVENFRKNSEGDDFEFLWLAEKGGEGSLSPDIEEIEDTLKNKFGKSVILIDRLDYLIFKNGFEKTLSFVQRLVENIYLTKCVIILSIDSSTLKEQELRLLEKEALEVKPRRMPRLPEDLLEILRFVYEQNRGSLKPSYKDVGREMEISKPTAGKRIRRLVSTGYLLETKKGRNKVIELSEEGRRLFT